MVMESTWKERNHKRIHKTHDIAKEMGYVNPVLIEYAPGSIVEFMLDWLPTGDVTDLTTNEEIRNGLIRLVEYGFRTTDLFGVQTYEPREIAEHFADLDPRVLYVVDKNKSVIEAVRSISQEMQIPVWPLHVETDMARIPYQGDIVFAYHFIDKPKGNRLEHVLDSVKEGGLLSTTTEINFPNFKKMDNGIYLKN